MVKSKYLILFLRSIVDLLEAWSCSLSSCWIAPCIFLRGYTSLLARPYRHSLFISLMHIFVSTNIKSPKNRAFPYSCSLCNTYIISTVLEICKIWRQFVICSPSDLRWTALSLSNQWAICVRMALLLLGGICWIVPIFQNYWRWWNIYF